MRIPAGSTHRLLRAPKRRTLILPPLPAGSYGVAVETGSAQWEGAFDVVKDPRQVTRYAFLFGFYLRGHRNADVDWIRRLHFNAVQFYDWMYRHDMLLPPQERYLDPMGRETDLAAIRAKIAACKAAGFAPLPTVLSMPLQRSCLQSTRNGPCIPWTGRR